jgi:hypothetical protein
LSKTGPLVWEIPAGQTVGIIMDFWQRPLADFGLTGSDKGEGVKLLIVGPGQKAPENTVGYRVIESPSGEHFKPGARKGRGVVHLIGWAASWNTILSPKLTMSTFGFAGFTRCSGGAFSYDPIAP